MSNKSSALLELIDGQVMDYSPQISGYIPQAFNSQTLRLFPNSGHPAVEHTFLTSNSQWDPPSSYNPDGYYSSHAVQTYSNASLSSRSDFTSSQNSLPLDPKGQDAVSQLERLPISNGPNNANVQPMAPPPSRKRKALTLRADDWEPVKARVIELHINQKLPLTEVKEKVEREFTGFTAT